MCLAGTVVASWSHTQEVAGPNPFTVMTNIFVTELSEFSETFRKNSIAFTLVRAQEPLVKLSQKLIIMVFTTLKNIF